MAEALNLVEKLAAVMAQVKHVPKSGWNDFHKYKYATEADITDCVRAAMAERGVMLIPSVEKTEWRTVQNKSGAQEVIATLTVRFMATDGKDKIEFFAIGEGQDRGDKATYKAMTGAVKYALLKLFLIPTGDDPEKEESEKPAARRPQQRAAPRLPPPPPPEPESAPAVAMAQADVIATLADPHSSLLEELVTPEEIKAVWDRLVDQVDGNQSEAGAEWKEAAMRVFGRKVPDPKHWKRWQMRDVEQHLFPVEDPADVPF